MDNLVIKILLADAAGRDRCLVKADAPNAYVQGERQVRPQTFMKMPAASADERADDGLGVPPRAVGLPGASDPSAPPAAFEFDPTSHADFGTATHSDVGGGTHRRRRATFERC